MKKILLMFVSLIGVTGLAVAQDDCMQFFPNTQGAQLVNTTYDAQNNMLSTMTYTIDKVYDYQDGTNMQIGFTMTGKDGSTIDTGTMNASCMDGSFRMNMINRGMTSDIMNAMTTDTELVGDFLDYPNVFNEDNEPMESPFTMDGGQFLVQSKSDKKEWVKVNIYNRQYVGDENITTPAKSAPFHAAKVTFDFDVTKDGKTTTYKGTEWYAMNSGVVRAETYDKDGNMMTSTILTTLKDNK
ncbi:hypothetical protein [Prevotella sp. 10(H)]|uniref:TapB family protein n=1 Tax=Prevotella sp. 10(H) TaxID=1158294 RepID=UPI0004A6B996|nr:hypothetical protein [Prevotella sp. 10(H)]